MGPPKIFSQSNAKSGCHHLRCPHPHSNPPSPSDLKSTISVTTVSMRNRSRLLVLGLRRQGHLLTSTVKSTQTQDTTPRLPADLIHEYNVVIIFGVDDGTTFEHRNGRKNTSKHMEACKHTHDSGCTAISVTAFKRWSGVMSWGLELAHHLARDALVSATLSIQSV